VTRGGANRQPDTNAALKREISRLSRIRRRSTALRKPPAQGLDQRPARTRRPLASGDRRAPAAQRGD